ncbi:hypothetical protein OB13_09100 [Pontibacter sp. HJ8]
MNRNQSDRDYGQHEGGFHTHRTERYRHPEQDTGYHSGYYGNEGNWGTRGNQGHEMGNARRDYTNINITDSDTYSTSRNYGNMGSYGGAQGFGDIRGGRHDSGHPFDSGTSSPGRERERGYNPRGYSSFGNESYDRGGAYGREQQRAGGSGRGYRQDQDDLYGQDTSRRFQGSSGQGRYNFERDDYYSSNYGDDQGNYMGSGYHRTTPGHYGTGDYGEAGYIEQNNPDRSRRGPREFNTAQNRWNTDW